MEEMVEIIDGKPMTTSLKVAEVFKIDHESVYQTIVTIRITLRSVKGKPLNFESKAFYDNNGTLKACFLMDQTDFSILSLCLTGENNMFHRRIFIEKFEQLKLELSNKQQELVNTYSLYEAMQGISDKLDVLKGLFKTKNTKEIEPLAEKDPTPFFFERSSEIKTGNSRKTGITDAARWVLPKLGLKPTITTNWLVEKDYLKTVPYAPGHQKLRALKVPTEKGKPYFQILPNLSLVVTPMGKSLLIDFKSAGHIPKHCLLMTR